MSSFGTLTSRKKVAHFFHELYFLPLIKRAAALFGESLLNDIDSHSKAALLLRLLGGQNVSKMVPEDQVKMIALIYQSIETPIAEIINETTLNRFLKIF